MGDVDEFYAVFFDLSWNTASKAAQSTNMSMVITRFIMVIPRAGQGKHLHILKVYIRELSCVPLQPFAMT